MYLKVGNAKLNYPIEPREDDYNVYAEIVESTISYETPVLVRNKDELDIWFGKDFLSYPYLAKLVEQPETALYLFRPIDKIQLTEEDAGEVFSFDKESHSVDKLEELPERDEFGVFWFVREENDWYTFFMGTWSNRKQVERSELGEKTLNESLFNRDTLSITTPKFQFQSYFHPKYNPLKETLYTDNIYLSKDETSSLSSVDSDEIFSGAKSLAFSVELNSSSLEKGYIVIEDIKDRKSYLYYYGSNLLNELPKDELKAISKLPKEEISSFSDLINKYSLHGYIVEKLNPTRYVVYSLVPIVNTNFYTISNINVEPNFEYNNRILGTIVGDSDLGISFISKTTGKTTDKYDEDEITITIEKDTDDPYNKKDYKITIKKYEYTEIFSGSISDNMAGTERLDFKISKNSKLVNCTLSNTSSGLRIGVYTMRGSYSDLTFLEKKCYTRTLDYFLDYAIDNEIYPDFVFIPSIMNYIYDQSEDDLYFSVYKKMLEYNEKLGSQYLIQEDDSTEIVIDITSGFTPSGGVNDSDIYKVKLGQDSYTWMKMDLRNNTYEEITGKDQWERMRIRFAEAGNSYVFNYLCDYDNKLVYFYQNHYIDGAEVPGYYPFLQGLLNNIYSFSSKSLSCDKEVNSNPYEPNELEETLESYKTHYMVSNGHLWYYQKPMNGSYWNTTIWMRFVLGKIWREFQKHRGELIGEVYLNKIDLGIKKIINKIVSSYSIVKSIDVESMDYNPYYSYLKLSLNVNVDDVVEKDMKIDFVINYSTK